MERVIKFRGLTTGAASTWVYGCLVNNLWTYSELSKYPKGTPVSEIIVAGECDDYVDLEDKELNVTVITESVGQFTGLQDKSGKDIYEGDIVQDIIVFMKSKIVFTDYANFGMKPINSTMKDLEYEIIDPAWTETSLEIIGNIYQHPELLTQLNK